MNPQFYLFKQKITNPVQFRLFMLRNLPVAFFSGLRIEFLNEEKAVISIRQKWFNKNPFHSIYFAMLSMTAELSTGILCMGALYQRNRPVSMLVVKNEGFFLKKATGKINFSCVDAAAINKAVEIAIATQEGTTVNCHAIGTNEQNEMVAEFYFTWSFKVKKISPQFSH